MRRLMKFLALARSECQRAYVAPAAPCQGRRRRLREDALAANRDIPMTQADPPLPPERRLRGILLRTAAISCSAILIACTKLASGRGVGTLEILFYRNALALPVVFAVVLLGPGLRSVRTARPGAHLSRSLLGIFNMLATFQAIAMLPLADATTIGFTAPLFATMLSAVLLGEPVHRHRWTAIAIGLAGVVVVMRPGSHHVATAGLGVALAAALGSGTATVTLRQIGATEPATTTVFWFTLGGTLASGLAMPFVAAWHDPLILAALVLGGLAGGAAQMLMTASLRHAPVSVLAPFDYLALPWSILYGWLLFAAAPSATTLAGGALIAASGLYTVHRERRLHLAATAARATPPTA